MKILIFFCAISFVSSDYIFNTFDEWKKAFAVTFDNVQTEALNQANFVANRAKVIVHNSNPNVTFFLTLNKFASQTTEEFIRQRCGMKQLNGTFLSRAAKRVRSVFSSSSQNVKSTSSGGGVFGQFTAATAPNSVFFNQFTLGVLDQGNCGSCWAFAAYSQLESMLMIRDNSYNTQLSPQFLMDCNLSNFACNGGWPTDAFQFTQRNFLGLDYFGGSNRVPTLTSYPYFAARSLCFTYFKQKVPVGINSVQESFLNGDEGALKAIVASNGPVVVGVDSTDFMQMYHSGIMIDSKADKSCNSLNHAVVLIGYGTSSTTGDYWLVKNSWGSAWGENGYFKVSRNNGNQINIACYIMYVT